MYILQIGKIIITIDRFLNNVAPFVAFIISHNMHNKLAPIIVQLKLSSHLSAAKDVVAVNPKQIRNENANVHRPPIGIKCNYPYSA